MKITIDTKFLDRQIALCERYEMNSLGISRLWTSLEYNSASENAFSHRPVAGAKSRPIAVSFLKRSADNVPSMCAVR